LREKRRVSRRMNRDAKLFVSRCTALAHHVHSLLQWTKARKAAGAAYPLAPRFTGARRCLSSRHSLVAADWLVLARRSPLPPARYQSRRPQRPCRWVSRKHSP
jgi:hypothetical protein